MAKMLRHYCYRIRFADGFTYFGARTCECNPAEDTSYMGSPVTHTAKWLTDIPRVKTIVSEHETREQALEAEAELIRNFWAVSKSLSLNASIGGVKFNRQGQSHTDETRARMSEWQKGKPKSAEHCAKMSAALTGKKMPPRTEEHLTRLSEAQKGKKHTDETLAKMSKVHAGRKWYTDGATDKLIKPDAVVPEGFRPGRHKY